MRRILPKWLTPKRVKKILIGLALLFVIMAILVAAVFTYYAGQIPDPLTIASRQVSESTKIYDRTGEVLLYDVHGDEKRTIVPWEQIADSVKKATLASEDNAFYDHQGVDFRGILRALYKDLTTFSVSQGGSTITQQLIKNALLGEQRQNFISVASRKIKEVVLSIQIERKFTKNEIFWMYLNQIPYGSSAYGIESASQTFFNKKANELTLAEAALLSSLPKAPSYYSPYGNHYPELIHRRDYVLERMRSLSLINEEEYQAALQEEVKLRPPRQDIKAPHFVIMVREYLVKKYGEEMVEKGGLQVITSLDIKLQEAAEGVVDKYGEINATRYRASNAALTALDPRTGQILAMVGSRDYFDIANDGNFNVATAFRQPGSSFKPFAYARFFQKGFPDSTILFDLKTEFNPNCNPTGFQQFDSFGSKCYSPQNYDGLFRGPVTARQAIAQSLNVPSVQVLYLAGLGDTIDLAKKMGITTLNDRNRYGLSLVLGGGEVRLLDMVSAFGVFANDGVRNPAVFISKVIAADGTILEEFHRDEEQIIEPQVARLISDVLSDNKSRSPTFGYNSALYFPGRPVAAKTGTTQENRDGWLIGYTPSLAVGIWTGNNDNKSMTQQGAGISAAGPMWHEFMAQALKDIPVEDFIKPDPLETITKPMLNGSYITESGIHSILYYVDRADPLGPIPVEPYRDPQFNNWESAAQRIAPPPLPSPLPGESPLVLPILETPIL